MFVDDSKFPFVRVVCKGGPESQDDLNDMMNQMHQIIARGERTLFVMDVRGSSMHKHVTCLIDFMGKTDSPAQNKEQCVIVLRTNRIISGVINATLAVIRKRIPYHTVCCPTDEAARCQVQKFRDSITRVPHE